MVTAPSLRILFSACLPFYPLQDKSYLVLLSSSFFRASGGVGTGRISHQKMWLEGEKASVKHSQFVDAHALAY